MDDQEIILRLEKLNERVYELSYKMAHLEQHSIRNTESLNREHGDIRIFEDRLRTVEQASASMNVAKTFTERIVWIIISGVFGAVGYFVSQLK